ncbi:MAG: hypothetical protein JOS17DRAFT_240129 [Linnemannia elongata]|nr:MAG: hypothetical protein JOS17DRAFT_240129 [Linnemannia elongata]
MRGCTCWKECQFDDRFLIITKASMITKETASGRREEKKEGGEQPSGLACYCSHASSSGRLLVHHLLVTPVRNSSYSNSSYIGPLLSDYLISSFSCSLLLLILLHFSFFSNLHSFSVDTLAAPFVLLAMLLNTSQMPLQQPNRKTLRSSTSSRPNSFIHLHNHRLATFFTFCLFLFTSLVNAQAATNSTASITISFVDTSGTPLPGSQPQTITQSACIPLNILATPPTTATTTTTATPDDETDPPNNSTNPVTIYATATASDQHAALNLYTDIYCQVMVSATVGFWNTSTTTPSLTGIKAIRWEGTAPATITPGTLSPVAFPSNMTTQALAPVEEDGTPKKKHQHKHQEFVMDPARGRAVVGLVSAILFVGIVIGSREVYKAAQYVPPMRSRPGSILSGKSGRGFGGYGGYSGDGSVIGTVGTKRVKKKEAYYRKPTASSFSSSSVGGAAFVREKDLQQQQLQPQLQQQQLSTGRSSMTTLATLRATTSSVTIDMGGSGENSSSLLHPTQGQGQGGHSGSSTLSLASTSTLSRLHIDLPPRLEVLVPFLPSPVEGNNNNSNNNNNNKSSLLLGSIDTKQP